jgi:RNA polymerase sigma-70 factor (ECF subfamily)
MVGTSGALSSGARAKARAAPVVPEHYVSNEQPDMEAEGVAALSSALQPVVGPAAQWEQEERALVERAQAGDTAAYGDLYERHVDRIYSYVSFKLGDRTEAEDVTEQVFLRALESLGSYCWQGVPFSSWLFRIAHNQIVDHLRRRSRRPQTALDASMRESSPAADPEGYLLKVLEREELVAAVGQLTPLQQQVILLRFAAELPTAEVARILGKSESAVKALQRAAIQKLQRRLRPPERR